MRTKTSVAWSVFAAGLFSFVAAGAEGEAAPDLRDWWEKSSLSFDPMISETLWRIEVGGMYNGQEGKAEGKVYNASARVVTRKSRVTNYAYGNIARQDVTYFGMEAFPLDTEQYALGDNVRYDVLRHVFLGAGVEKHRDTLLLIENRFSRYAGFGISADLLKKHLINIFLGYGKDDVDYMRGMLAMIDPDATSLDPSPSSGALFCRVRWTWQVSDTLTFREDFAYLNYGDRAMGERWNGNVALEVALNPHFSLSLGHTRESYDNDVVRAFGIPRRNTMQTVGVKFSY